VNLSNSLAAVEPAMAAVTTVARRRVRTADSKHHRCRCKRQVITARDPRRRSSRSREIISNSQSRSEHTTTEIAHCEKRDEYTSASSRRDSSCGGDRAQDSHRQAA
jgi:hypothetical protein